MLKFILKLFEGLNNDIISDMKGLNEMDTRKFYLDQESTVAANRSSFYLWSSLILHVAGFFFVIATHETNGMYWTLPLFVIFSFFFIIYSMLYFGTATGSNIKPTDQKRTTLKCKRIIKPIDIFSKWFGVLFLAYIIQIGLYISLTFTFKTIYFKYIVSGIILIWGLFLTVFTLISLTIDAKHYLEFGERTEYTVHYKDKNRKPSKHYIRDYNLSLTSDKSLIERRADNPFQLSYMEITPYDEIDYIQFDNIKVIQKDSSYEVE